MREIEAGNMLRKCPHIVPLRGYSVLSEGNGEYWCVFLLFDRLQCLEEQTTEILGTKIVSHAIPIRPGRNLAVIVETAAVNHRQKKMGYNAAQELYRRVQDNIMNKRGN